MKLSFYTLLPLLIILCSCFHNNPRAAAVLKINPNAEAGKPIYDSQCASCHGIDGGKHLPRALKILPPQTNLSIVIDGVKDTKMRSYGNLSDQELADLFAYMKTLKGRQGNN